jgi:hypothetical protein
MTLLPQPNTLLEEEREEEERLRDAALAAERMAGSRSAQPKVSKRLEAASTFSKWVLCSRHHHS